jgi:aspartyl-tRNA(Asn)/glutamyl-tRNA(Gln) amidotransferase subunit A
VAISWRTNDMNDLLAKSALELLALIRQRQISPVELVQASLDRIGATQPTINAFVTVTPELALAAARECERELAQGKTPRALHGLPISVKDLIALEGVPLTFGSRTMKDNIARLDAPSVERIKAAGACIVGKTTTTEFGCKVAGDSPLTGITRNPWNLGKTPGGSSSGAAASVAAHVTPFALGTDAGGSIREPAAFTGLFGIKAQFARVPLFPPSAAPTLAHVGPFARTVGDAALLLQVIAGYDARDPFSVSEPVPDFLAACEQPVKGMRIAWSPTMGYAKASAEILAITERAAKTFESFGCTVELVETVFEEDPADIWTSDFYGGIRARFGQQYRESRDTLDPALVVTFDALPDEPLSAYYAKVFRRYDLRERMRLFFERYDLLLTPQTPLPAIDVGVNIPPEFPERNLCSWLFYPYPFNLTGQPAASVPAGLTAHGLPVGLQIVARTNHEVDVFRAAAAFEEARGPMPFVDTAKPRP